MIHPKVVDTKTKEMSTGLYTPLSVALCQTSDPAIQQNESVVRDAAIFFRSTHNYLWKCSPYFKWWVRLCRGRRRRREHSKVTSWGFRYSKPTVGSATRQEPQRGL